MANKYTTSTALYSNAIYGLDATIAPTSVVNYYIANAEATIDSYISKQYTLPLDAKPNTPPIIFRVATDLSAYLLLNYLYSQQNQNVNKWVEELGSKSMAMLENISTDKMRAVYAAGTMATMDLNISLESNMEDIPLVANMDDVLNWRVSGSLNNQIFQDRSSADPGSIDLAADYYLE